MCASDDFPVFIVSPVGVVENSPHLYLKDNVFNKESFEVDGEVGVA